MPTFSDLDTAQAANFPNTREDYRNLSFLTSKRLSLYLKKSPTTTTAQTFVERLNVDVNTTAKNNDLLLPKAPGCHLVTQVGPYFT
jgi:hypothetical protein